MQRRGRPLGLPEFLTRSIEDAQNETGQFAEENRANAMPGPLQFLGDVGTMGAEMTGIPSVVRGAGNISRGAGEGDAIRTAGGVGQVALGAMPGAALMRQGRAALGAIMPNAPAAGAVIGGLTLPSAYADDAEAAGSKRQSAIDADPRVAELRARKQGGANVGGDPEVQRLRADAAKLQAELDTINEKNARAGKVKHETAVEGRRERLRELQKQLSAAETRAGDTSGVDAELKAAEEAAATSYMENAPFRERFPGAAQTIFAGGMGLAGGLSAGKGLSKSLGDAMRGRKLNTATDAAEAEMRAIASGEGNPVQAALAQELLRRRLNRIEPTGSGMMGAIDRTANTVKSAYNGAGNALKGAVIGAEASSIPEQVDYISFPPGHPTREAAADQFQKKSYYGERLAPAILGGGVSSLASTVGARTGRAITGGAGGDTDRARLIASLGGEESAAALEQVRRFQQQSGALRQKSRPSSGGTRSEPDRTPPVAGSDQPLDPVTYRSYGALPDSVKQSVREAYVANQSLNGAGLPPREGAQNLRELFASRGVNVPITPARVQHTNDAIGDFQAQNGGRLPTTGEFAQVFNRGTLALPMAAGAGAAAMSMGEGEEQPQPGSVEEAIARAMMLRQMGAY